MNTSKTTRTTRNRTQAEKVYTYLNGGDSDRTLTARQAKSRFQVKNLRAVISDIRDMGIDVVTEMRESRTSKGSGPVAFYSLGLDN
jgi:hypothetical protein